MESDPKYEQRELPALATRGGRPLSLLSANSPAAQPPLGKEFAFHFPGSGVVGPKRPFRLRRHRPHLLHRPQQPRHERPLRSPRVM